uniref:Uncharacterized protein n=1 Tax=Arundo donax TaxID=35708 RepID=A0A0A9AHN7_ARUDO
MYLTTSTLTLPLFVVDAHNFHLVDFCSTYQILIASGCELLTSQHFSNSDNGSLSDLKDIMVI